MAVHIESNWIDIRRTQEEYDEAVMQVWSFYERCVTGTWWISR